MKVFGHHDPLSHLSFLIKHSLCTANNVNYASCITQRSVETPANHNYTLLTFEEPHCHSVEHSWEVQSAMGLHPIWSHCGSITSWSGGSVNWPETTGAGGAIRCIFFFSLCLHHDLRVLFKVKMSVERCLHCRHDNFKTQSRLL